MTGNFCEMGMISFLVCRYPETLFGVSMDLVEALTWNAEAGTDRVCLSSSFPWYGTEIDEIEESLESVRLSRCGFRTEPGGRCSKFRSPGNNRGQISRNYLKVSHIFPPFNPEPNPIKQNSSSEFDSMLDLTNKRS